MTPKRPYLIRAMYDWIKDNDAVPYIVVDTTVGNCHVPDEYINEKGNIVLNINDSAVWDLVIGDDLITFGARFKGIAYNIRVPTSAVTAIYVKDTGEGMLLGEATAPEEPQPEPEQKVPHLRLVVNNDES